ncbi:transposase family protein [Mastigocoleus testarum]|uniref:DDE endonuclease n=1 Tax=Mastigocoleus testarum BC008 TaxID=371196 RepID=A0A0V7ZVT3_9CYAN|nr:transposase family protein [Mastigocoleus testarum]KST68749.1 DDE endonuclease [Mastigocoleus testarum BC008]
MSIVFKYIQKYPQRTKQLLGISYEQYQALLKAALNKHIKIQKEKESQKIRINSPGGGRKELLSSVEQICLCLFYLRQIPTFEILGMLFGVSKSEAHITFHYWIKILREILPSSLLEQVEDKEGDLIIVQEILINFKLLVDSLEQPIERPFDNEKQKKFYSGKKKQHTLKSQLVSLPNGQDIVDVEVGFPGPTADINLFREQQNKFDEQQGFEGDKGYQGGKNITTPHKKKRKQQLNEQQKIENRILSSKRIYIEHLIRIVRVFKIASQRFRLNSNVYKEIILTVCGLVRLRIGTLVLTS